MRYKLIIFDFDGTLADTFAWFVNIMDELAEKYKFTKINKAELETLRSFDANKMIKHHAVPLWKMPMIGNHVRKAMARDINQIHLFKGTGHLLQRLAAKGIKLAIATSNSYDNVLHLLGPQNATLIGQYECGVSVFGKSSKLKKIVKKSGVQCDETILIGDEIRDIDAARKANIAFGAVSWGYTRIEALKAHSPKEVFATLDDIARKIA